MRCGKVQGGQVELTRARESKSASELWTSRIRQRFEPEGAWAAGQGDGPDAAAMKAGKDAETELCGSQELMDNGWLGVGGCVAQELALGGDRQESRRHRNPKGKGRGRCRRGEEETDGRWYRGREECRRRSGGGGESAAREVVETQFS